MAFDLNKFEKAKFEARTEAVPVPVLAGFFAEGEKAEFVIRGLTGEEMARVNAASDKHKNLLAVVEALSGDRGKVQGIKELVGLGDDVPSDLARRIEMLTLGCVEPSLDLQAASKLFKAFPVEGYNLTNKITLLSGQGMVLGEPRASGKKKKSG